MEHRGRCPYRRDDADNESVQDLRELFLKTYSHQNDKSAGGNAPALRIASVKRSGDAVGPFAAFGFKRLDLEPEPFADGARDEPPNTVRLPARCAHEVLQGGAARAFQQGDNLGLFGVLSACVRVLLARGLPGGLAPRRRDVAAVFARGEALDSPPDPSCRYGAVGEPLDRR